MANIKKGARAYYADTDYKRDGMNEAYGKIDSMPAIPTPEDSDAGKVIKVNDSGAYALSDDLHTPVVANPEGTPTAELNTVQIGDTVFKVNEARVSKLLNLRLTINSGGENNASLPYVAFVDINNNVATLPNYTMTCDKPIQYGSLTVNGGPAVNSDKLPAAFTIAFANEFNIEDFPYIRLTKPGLFPTDVAKNIKIEYSINGNDYVEIADLVSIDWTTDVHVYDMSNGEEVTTVPGIPTPTIADAGKVLTVDNNGEWELDNVPSELPSVTSADAGKVLIVDNNGAWSAENVSSGSTIKIYDVTVSGNDYSLANGKTYNDILNDINNNNIVYLRRYSRQLFPLSITPLEGVSTYIRFVWVFTNGSQITVENLDVATNNSITHTVKNLT